MAMVNMNNLLNGKDSRWLQLEVCREFQRNKCSRPDTECKFAHPPANVEVQNGRVTACYDSIKGRCNREKPPCKYFHPPQHLKDQLLINGRNHLALKNALMQQMGLAPGQTLVPGQMPASAVAGNAPFLGIPAQVAAAGSFSPFYTPGSSVPTGLLPVIPADNSASQLAVMPQGVTGHQKLARSDRLEVDVKSLGNFYYDAFTGMAVPYKRAATDKSGVPVYPQPSGNTLQQLMTLQQQPTSYIPVTLLPTVSQQTASGPAQGLMVPAALNPAEKITFTPLISNAHSVVYTDAEGQLLDTLPVCQDFSRNCCKRPACKFVHLTESNVEVVDNHVTVCRDDVSGRCTRALCKYYHIPVELPPAPQMARLHSLVNKPSAAKLDSSQQQHEVTVVHQQAAPIVYAAPDAWVANDNEPPLANNNNGP
ncbi:muscleblind-like protein isoform X3 [Neocloeon triangulifer]|uniref:muscleblind-like protein isoform X3 n=1 Tax=Neocloeon triangulifer TaxID=2078957 RepID=UPI00286EEBB3|nr:muscleblind-like protein isoform X3 [Neocloeon triangulifer]